MQPPNLTLLRQKASVSCEDSWSFFDHDNDHLSKKKKVAPEWIAKSARAVEYTDCFSAEG